MNGQYHPYILENDARYSMDRGVVQMDDSILYQ